jgi:hypothetical protein
MAGFAGTTQGTCRREMNKLVATGIFTTLQEGNLQHYQIYKVNPLYKEFKSIIQKTIGIEAILRNALQVVEGIAYAFIFGSYAKLENYLKTLESDGLIRKEKIGVNTFPC